MSHLGCSLCPPYRKVAPARTTSSWTALSFKNIHVKPGMCTNHRSEEVLEIVVTVLEWKKRKARSLFKKTKRQQGFYFIPNAFWQVTSVVVWVLSTTWQQPHFSSVRTWLINRQSAISHCSCSAIPQQKTLKASEWPLMQAMMLSNTAARSACLFGKAH